MNKKLAKLALISVYNKEGITEFVQHLTELGFEILSSGGTAKHLKEAGVSVIDVGVYTGLHPILDHRVATLHPKIYAGILSDLRNGKHLAEIKEFGAEIIDLVCVDFYPLQNETANPNATLQSVIEKTDIGGPTLVRAAAKGRRIVICDPTDCEPVIEWIETGEPDAENFKRKLAAKAEQIVSHYTGISAEYLGEGKYKSLHMEKVIDCKYGENAWQTPAAFYKTENNDPLALENFKVVAGSAPSYNNMCEIDRSLQTLTHIAAGFERNLKKVPFIALATKHGNPCGCAISSFPSKAISKMIAGDNRAIHGGSVITNFPINAELASLLITDYGKDQRRLLDTITAPSITEEAIDILSRKKGKCRIMINPALANLGEHSLDTAQRFRYVRGGMLVQPNYTFIFDLDNPEVRINGGKKKAIPETQVKMDMILAWAIGSTSNSNTITIVKDGMLYGNGVGQQDRVGAAELAVKKASGDPHLLLRQTTGCVAYSDSFFPFKDGLSALAIAGVDMIIGTHGSVNDPEVFAAAQEMGITMVTLPDSMARGFFGH